MQSILAVTVPFFALVLCGYLAARRHVLPESAIPGLNSFVLYFALPCLLFRFGASTPILDLLNPSVMLVYLASALLIELAQNSLANTGDCAESKSSLRSATWWACTSPPSTTTPGTRRSATVASRRVRAAG